MPLRTLLLSTALLLSTGLLLSACAPMDPPSPSATDGGVCEAPQVAAAVPGAPCCYACSPTVTPVPGQRCVPSYCRCAASADGGAAGCCCTMVSPGPWVP